MTHPHAYNTLVLFTSLALAACSDGGSPHAATASAGESDVGGRSMSSGGATPLAEVAGSDAGGTPSGGAPATAGNACWDATTCDDGVPCNGTESCVDNACQPGAAPTCGVGMACSNDDAGTCMFTDSSPWIIYQADDDTPGVPEVYAVKRGLLGEMEPIKINAPLAEGWEAYRPGKWSPDGKLYSFAVIHRDPYKVGVHVVHFGMGVPKPAVELDGEEVQWSPSGKLFAVAETNGVAIYSYSGSGAFELAHRETTPTQDQFYGMWAANDAFIFTSHDTLADVWHIYSLSSDTGDWQVQVASSAYQWLAFEVSPSLTEIIYEATDAPNERSSLFAQSLARPGERRLLSGPERHSFAWSPDRQGYLLQLAADTSTNDVRVFLGHGDAVEGNVRSIAEGRTFAGASFNPTGKSLLLSNHDDVWGRRLSTYDLDSNTGTSLSRTTGDSDEVRFSPDGGWVAMSSRESQTSDIELELIAAGPGRDNLQLDLIPSTLHFYNLQFSKQSKFFAYYKGDSVARDYDAAYVDLRYHTVVDPKPVSLPGEGSMWTMGFDPDGSGLYYIKERSDGGRNCYYLDLSQQVAKEPVKVNRAGRTNFCNAQPLGD